MPETSAQNKQLIKRLLAEPGNKNCADCKTATHPRWTSWNIGVFLCIRCSGVHRSLGTHISKVRSIDLDSWSDAQLVELQRWGNTKANQYWEAGLPANHIPDESKIVNFIRTKYDLRRWASATKPSPEALPAVASEDVPLQQVRDTARLGRANRLTSAPAPAAPAAPANLLDFDDFSSAPPLPGKSQPTTGSSASSSASSASGASGASGTPARYSSKPTATSAPAPQPVARAAPHTTQPQPKSALPALPGAVPGAAPRTQAPRSDLKKSILSLYAQKPTPTATASAPSSAPSSAAPSAAPSATASTNSFDFDLLGARPTTTAPPAPNHTSLIDSFESPTFGSLPAPTKPAPAPTGAPVAPAATTSFPDFGFSAPKPAPKSIDAIVQPTASSTFAPVEEDDFFANPWK